MRTYTLLFYVLAVISLAVISKCDEPAPAAEEKPEPPEAPEPTEKPETPEAPETLEKPKTPEKPETTAKPETTEKPETPAKPETSEKPTEAPTVQTPAPSSEGGTATVALEYLQLHNNARKKAKLSELAWEDSLVGKAKTIVESCQKPKEVFSDDSIVEYKKSKKLNLKSTFSAWLRQGKKVRKGDTSKCCSQKRKSCCYYAKVTSPKYKNVGCASNFCKKLTDGKRSLPNRFLTACVYN